MAVRVPEQPDGEELGVHRLLALELAGELRERLLLLGAVRVGLQLLRSCVGLQKRMELSACNPSCLRCRQLAAARDEAWPCTAGERTCSSAAYALKHRQHGAFRAGSPERPLTHDSQASASERYCCGSSSSASMYALKTAACSSLGSPSSTWSNTDTKPSAAAYHADNGHGSRQALACVRRIRSCLASCQVCIWQGACAASHRIVLVFPVVPDQVLLHQQLLNDRIVDARDGLWECLAELPLGL